MEYVILIVLLAMVGAGTSDTIPQAADARNVNTAQIAQERLPRQGENAAPQRFVANNCVFILATGQSGSTALMDALNQLPNYLIRGEQWAAFWNVYESYMNFNWTTAIPLSQTKFNWSEHRHESFEQIKSLYNQEATQEKLPWFNEFPVNRVMAAARSYYAVLYGYYGKNFVSGFKDSRYVCGRSFQSDRCAEFFFGFMKFLRKLCLHVKVVLNTRESPSLEANAKLFDMDRSRPEEEFQKDLENTHALFDEYVKQNPENAFRVIYEHMYDAKKNATLAKNLLAFLKEDPSTPISFTRMPASKTPN